MDFDWSKIKFIDGEQFSSDNLDRAKYATYLASLIKAKGGTDKDNLSNYVLNLDAEWGAGKTYFLKRWSEDLKGNHPVVYIDAWAIDYLESPLMIVLSEIIEQLKSQTDRADTPKAKAKFKEIIKAAAPRVGSGLMKRYLGFDLDVFDSSHTDDANLSNKEIDFSKAGEKVLEIFCKEVTDSKKSVKALKLAIQDWVEYVVDHPVRNMNTITNSYPAFIFVDELDRCKPTYAVEMLEAIKHVFDIPGLVFIVATNTSQLAHTVKAVYGVDFNAEEYLSRFFNNRYYLKTELNKGLIENHCNIGLVNADKLKSMQVILFPFVCFDGEKFLTFCISVFSAVDLTPRQAVKVFDRIQLTFLNLKKNTCVNIAAIVLLFATQEKSSKMFEVCFNELIIANGILRVRELYPNFGKKFINVNLDLSLETLQVRSDYLYLEGQVYDFETQNINGHNLKHMNITLHKLLGSSFGLDGLARQGEKVSRLVQEKHPRDLQSEALKYYILLIQMKTDPEYYKDLTNMAVNLD
ncbi:P-loop NTPase fold protein [Pseudoalteromonas sp. SR43-3]|uniref:KAP family P-loop NTPase fold protein n=1 Tax=Pseudoalteromonas sp. SR43-3 TaxID=2760943 RepID=UPI0016021B58|nr:P-loop NTPase fold protein [Pseudoalteromonas sp. SR43-3]MBB1276878.1 NTPase KAP [Pseudoalteromonas sp. SR43-3]